MHFVRKVGVRNFRTITKLPEQTTYVLTRVHICTQSVWPSDIINNTEVFMIYGEVFVVKVPINAGATQFQCFKTISSQVDLNSTIHVY